MADQSVIDASALAAATFREPAAEQVRMMTAGRELIAPDLLFHEIGNVCVKKIRRQPEREAELIEMYELAFDLNIQSSAVDHHAAMRLAIEYGLSAYDASYLWLAIELGVDLITLDRRLQQAFETASRRH